MADESHALYEGFFKEDIIMKRQTFRWQLLSILPVLAFLCPAVFVSAAPASAATLYPCQGPYSNSGYYPALSWGYDVNHAFSTDTSNYTIFIYESGLSQQTEYPPYSDIGIRGTMLSFA
jgi:hypothetical protein